MDFIRGFNGYNIIGDHALLLGILMHDSKFGDRNKPPLHAVHDSYSIKIHGKSSTFIAVTICFSFLSLFPYVSTYIW